MSKILNEIINSGQDLLARSGIDKSRFETMLIAQNVLRTSMLNILTNSNMVISDKIQKEILKRIFKRSKRKPISKIFGIKEFYSKEFYVSKNVLDPRPESELIVDIIKELDFTKSQEKFKILELGVGSGCLIITILLQLKDLNINGLGVDICNKAILVAKRNLEKFKLQDTLEIKKSDWFSNVDGKFDLILSNPPYLQSSEIKFLNPEVKFYDPQVSLDGGNKGLSCYEKIAKNAGKYIKKNGKICLEIGLGQSNAIRKIFNRYGFKIFLEEKDLQGVNRVVVYKLK